MSNVKIINKKSKAIYEVKDNLASDYIGTGDFELYNEDKQKDEVVNSDIKVGTNKFNDFEVK